MTDGEKERLKLTANSINVLAAGTVITGGIAPLVAAFFRTAAFTLPAAAVGSSVCLAIGFLLRFGARSFLKRLDR